MFSPYFVMQYLLSFLVLQSSFRRRELVVLLLKLSFLHFFLIVPWVGLQCFIVTFHARIQKVLSERVQLNSDSVFFFIFCFR